MKNPLDKITRRWRRKQEEPIVHEVPEGKYYQTPITRKGNRADLKRLRRHGANPEWSKKRRVRNKRHRVMLQFRGHKPHGRQTKPGPRAMRKKERSSGSL